MAIDVNAIKAIVRAGVDQAYTLATDPNSDQNAVRDLVADAIATAVVTAIQSMTITIGPNQINTVGTAAAQSNALPVVITNVPPNSIS